MSKTDFLIRCLSDKPVKVVPNSGEILTELKRQGNNFNQAIKNMHCGRIMNEEILLAVDELKKLYRNIPEAVGGD